MLAFFWYMLKVIICSGILFAYYWLFLRNKIFHQYNRFYLLTSIGLSLLLPLLQISFWQPAQQTNQAIKVLQAVSVGDDYMNTVITTAKKSTWSFEQLYIVTYWLVSIIFCFVTIRTLLLIRKLLKQYPVQQVEDVSFINTQHSSTPFSFLRYIFWNSDIDINTTTGRQIFKHEVAHIQQKHTHDKLFVNILLIFCWCNPFFWLYRKELNMIHEFIADKKAVEDSDIATFAAMILQAAYPKHQFEVVNNFFYSPIKRRLMMLTKNKNPKVNYIGRIMVLPLLALIFTAFSLKKKEEKRIDAKADIGKNNLLASKKYADIIKALIKKPDLIIDTVPAKIITGINPNANNSPLYIVNDKETDKIIALAIKPDEIQDIHIIKDQTALKDYGDKGKNGVVVITLKKNEKIDVAANDLTLYADKATLQNDKTDLALVGNVNIVGDLKGITVFIDGKEATEKEFRAIDPARIDVVNVENNKVKDKKIIYVSLKKPAEPKIYIGRSSGGRILLNYLKAQDVITVTAGYSFVGAGVYISGPSFKKAVKFYQISSSASLTSMQETIVNECHNGDVLVFDNVWVKDKDGNKMMISAPPAFSLYDEPKDANINLQLQPATDDKIFTATETPAQYTGGSEAWLKFLRANLKVSTPIDNGAKAGVYKVVMKFIVNIDGTLSNITCENDPGYGTSAEAIRFIKTTPRWQPAMQNGKKVNAYLKQPITFVVEE